MPAKGISSTKKLRAERLKLSEKVRNDLLKRSNELRSEVVKLSEKVRNDLLSGDWRERQAEEMRSAVQNADRYVMQVRSALERLNTLVIRPDDALELKVEPHPRRAASASSTWIHPDDAPEWSKEDFERADLYHGDKLIRRGRPPSDHPKQALKLRIDPDVIEHFRATGPGWQTRINDALRRAAKLSRRKAG